MEKGEREGRMDIKNSINVLVSKSHNLENNKTLKLFSFPTKDGDTNFTFNHLFTISFHPLSFRVLSRFRVESMYHHIYPISLCLVDSWVRLDWEIFISILKLEMSFWQIIFLIPYLWIFVLISMFWSSSSCTQQIWLENFYNLN